MHAVSLSCFPSRTPSLFLSFYVCVCLPVDLSCPITFILLFGWRVMWVSVSVSVQNSAVCRKVYGLKPKSFFQCIESPLQGKKNGHWKKNWRKCCIWLRPFSWKRSAQEQTKNIEMELLKATIANKRSYNIPYIYWADLNRFGEFFEC